MNYARVIIPLVMAVNLSCFGNISDDVSELLNKFSLSQTYQENYSSNLLITRETIKHLDASLVGNIHKDEYIFQRVGNKTKWSGKTASYSKNGELNYDPHRFLIITNDMEHVRMRDVGDSSPYAAMTRNQKAMLSKQQELLYNPTYGSPLFGKIFGSNNNDILALLKEGDAHIIREEIISGIPCVLVSNKNKYGNISVWIAPSRGYSAVKWSIQKNADDIFDSTTLSEVGGSSWSCEFQVNKFEKVNGIYVIANAVYNNKRQLSDNTQVEYINTYSCSNINPEFNDTEAFKVNLPNNIKVYLEEAPTISYVWNNGELSAYVPDTYLETLDKAIIDIKQNTDKPENNSVLPANQNSISILEKTPTEEISGKKNNFTKPLLFLFSSIVGIIFMYHVIKGRKGEK